MMDTKARSPLLVALVLLAACARERATGTGSRYETLTLRYEGSAGTVNMPELAEDLGYLAPVKLAYIGNNSTGGPHSIQAVATGDVDIGGSFNGSIVKLVSRRAPIRAVVANYGVDPHRARSDRQKSRDQHAGRTQRVRAARVPRA
jgi:ABC-type nitrate/sulfonate/bicarbonate transport system substrate-binding protein